MNITNYVAVAVLIMLASIVYEFIVISRGEAEKNCTRHSKLHSPFVDQADNNSFSERPLQRRPTARPPFGCALSLSVRFYTPTLIRPRITSDRNIAVLGGGQLLRGFLETCRDEHFRHIHPPPGRA